MNRLNDNQVERLLKEAAKWEPDAQMPESLIRSALTKSPRRKYTPLVSALSLSGAAFAGLMTFVVFRPEVPPTVAQPTPLAVKATPETGEKPATLSTPAPTPASIPATHVAQNTPEKSSTVSKPSNREDKPLHKRSHGKRRSNRSTESQARASRQELPKLEYAPSTYENEPKPLPDNAISLDESPKIVPVVVADTDPETGEVLLRPAAAMVPASSADAPISLE
ncbi:MAG: hypothetical protein QM758_11915 [Armatimonas sp.]